MCKITLVYLLIVVVVDRIISHYVIIMILIYLILCIAQVHATLNEDLLKQNKQTNTSVRDECILKIIRENINEEITLVNFNNNELLKNIQTACFKKNLVRDYLSLELGIENEAYIVNANNISDFRSGMEHLTKDYFWNPRAPFIIITEKIFEKDIEESFHILHKLFVFNVLVISRNNTESSNHLHVYNFKKSKHCLFQKEAIEAYNCENSTHLKEFQASVLNLKTLRSAVRLNIPYSGCYLKFFMNPLIPYNFPAKKEEVEIIGYDEAFYKATTEMGFFEFDLIHANKPQQLGQPTKDFVVNGLMKLIQNGTIDGMVGAIILSINRIGPFDFVYPHAADRFLVFLPRPSEIEKWKVMFFTFSPTVWILTFLTFCIVFVSALLLKVFGKNSFQNPMLVLFVTFGYFVGATNNIDDKWRARFLVISWALFTWFISCFYQSDLTSVFTTPQRYPNIKSLEELVKLNYELHMNQVTFNYINTTKVFLYDYGVIDKAKICDDRMDCLKTVAKGGKKCTIVTQKYFTFFQTAFLDGNHQSLFNILEEQHYLFMTTYVRKGHPDIERLRYLQSQFTCSGLYNKQLMDLTFNNSLKYHYNETGHLHPLTLKEIEGLFYFFLGGCLVSSLVFIYEISLWKPFSLKRCAY